MICGDKKLNYLNKFLYLFKNLFRGIIGSLYHIDMKFWHVNKLDLKRSSPSRKIIDQFLLCELEKLLPKGKITILDIGCGSGYVQDILSKAKYEGRYIGVDVKRNRNFHLFQNEKFKSKFIESKIEDFQTGEKFDLIISITALEHIENDKLVINKCHRMLKRGGLQVHIVPSFWSLFLYLWHGYRQYSAGLIERLLGGKKYRVYRLGGFFSFLSHLFFITIPIHILKSDRLRDLKIYPKLASISNRLDRFLPVCSTIFVITVQGNNEI